MTRKSTKLEQLQQKLRQKQHLEHILTELNEQRPALSEKTAALKQVMDKEQTDVDKLERGSLSAFFYELFGKKEEKLTKEKKEAYEAHIKYSAAAQELRSLDDRLQRTQSELLTLQTVQEEYDSLLAQTLSDLIAAGHPSAQEIIQLQQEIAECRSKLAELDEAHQAGQTALSTTDAILSHLSDAEDWGTFDLFGGGLLADLAKHDALDAAQKEAEHLQTQLRTFKTELTDVTVEANLRLTIDGFLGFADFFFDGFFADWTVMSEIEHAVGRVKTVQGNIRDVITRLEQIKADTIAQQTDAQAKLEGIAVQT